LRPSLSATSVAITRDTKSKGEFFLVSAAVAFRALKQEPFRNRFDKSFRKSQNAALPPSKVRPDLSFSADFVILGLLKEAARPVDRFLLANIAWGVRKRSAAAFAEPRRGSAIFFNNAAIFALLLRYPEREPQAASLTWRFDMVILVPLKLVVLVWLFLSAMLLAGYVASSLIRGKTPFAPYSLPHAHHPIHYRSVHRSA
jgi:hypothetical protein